MAVGVTVGSLAAIAVPVVQAALLGLTERPLVPGPHDLDGLFLHDDDDSRPLSIVWLGDSLASGVGADTPDASFPRMSAALYRSAHERSVQVTSLAVAGARATDVLAAQVPLAVALLGAGSVAILLVGSNDVGTLNRPRRFRRQYRAIRSATVLAQPLRAIAGWVGRRADRDVRRLAAVHGAHYIDINCRPPAAQMPLVFLAADNYHPNDETYRFWADRLATFLRPILHPRAA
jgi:lysophospholipase L1-like esterase